MVTLAASSHTRRKKKKASLDAHFDKFCCFVKMLRVTKQGNKWDFLFVLFWFLWILFVGLFSFLFISLFCSFVNEFSAGIYLVLVVYCFQVLGCLVFIIQSHNSHEKNKQKKFEGLSHMKHIFLLLTQIFFSGIGLFGR